jgi:hypothetical protein
MKLDLSTSMHISKVESDGFIKMVDVDPSSAYHSWEYINVHPDCLLNHCSWVYMITVLQHVVKNGETGLPLLIPGSANRRGPQLEYTKTGCRFGRLSKGGDTDLRIRRDLSEHVTLGQVSVYALQLPIATIMFEHEGAKVAHPAAIHKQKEQMYFDTILRETGVLPLLNPHRK